MTQTIPLDAIPNQSLSIRLEDRRYVITVRDIGDMMAVTVERDDVVLISGVRACAGSPLIPYPYLTGDAGNFAFTNTVAGNAPRWEDFGAACFLVYLTAAEIEAA